MRLSGSEYLEEEPIFVPGASDLKVGLYIEHVLQQTRQELLGVFLLTQQAINHACLVQLIPQQLDLVSSYESFLPEGINDAFFEYLLHHLVPLSATVELLYNHGTHRG